jgi:hypothetical protein
MALSDYPKASNALLSREEKKFLDTMPDDVVKTFLSELDGQTRGTFTGIDNEGVFKLTFEGEDRLQAIRDYFEMLFEFGVRERPVDGGN